MSAPEAARHGRTGVFSLGLIVGFLLLGYAVLRALELSPRVSPSAVESSLGSEDVPVLGAFRAQVELEGASVRALLVPLHDEPRLEAFRAAALRARYGLPEGFPWRLYLWLEEESALPVRVLSARVAGALRPFAELASALERVDPVHALLAAPPAQLVLDGMRVCVLWGPQPAEGALLELEGESGAASGTLAPDDGERPPPRWLAGRALPQEERSALETEIVRLEGELQRERRRRMEREAAFLEFSRMVAELPLGRESDPESPGGERRAHPSREELELQAVEDAARARAEELGRGISVLMRLEGLRGLDLLDAGTLQAGPPAGIGPVLFRCLDERGLLTGSLYAESLRLEGSTAAHTLTLVLEDGYESHAGERVPFTRGVRRITLTDVDPGPWQEDCPELFGSGDLLRANDDGLWDLRAVRRELNRLLARDTGMGWYRLHSLGGVRGTGLMDVQLEQREPSGRLERRLFADRLFLTLEDGGVVVELEDGAFVRGGEKRPFRDGRHRIVLAGVADEEWLDAPLPGFSEPPEAAKSSGTPAANDAGGR